MLNSPISATTTVEALIMNFFSKKMLLTFNSI